MKKIFLFFLSFSLFVYAETRRGFPVSVELISGAKQNAELVGAAGDTLFLGGFVADTFTVVKILKSRVANLRDSSGNAIVLAEVDSLFTKNDSAHTDSILKENVPSDSLPDSSANISSIDSTANDSATAPQIEQINLSNKALVFPALRRPIDSALAERIRILQLQTLHEKGLSPIAVSTNDFPQCKNSPCIAQEAESRNAHSVWTLEIQPAKHQDSLDLFLHQFLIQNKSQTTAKLTLSAKNATTELLSADRFVHWMEKALGIYQEPVREKSTKSFIYVETDPEGANLSHKGEDVICQTPCAFAIEDTGKVELEAFWDVENTLWANKATIRPIPGDTAKINLRLKRVKPEVEIHSVPAGAQIYEAEEITPHSRPIGKTPKILTTRTPGPAELHLWREGFRDTVIQFRVSATSKTIVEVQLDTLQSKQELESQAVFQQIQKRIFWGHLSLGVSIAPAVAGGILLYIAEKDRDKARDIRDELKMPSSGGGEHFQKLVDKNHRYADRSKTERYVGTGLLIFAGGLLAAGIVLSF